MTRPVRTCEAPKCRRHLPPGRRRFCSDICRLRGQRAERRLDPGEFGRAVIRMIRAMSGRAGSSDLAEFALLWEVRAEADRAAAEAIDTLRAKGFSWTELAAETDITRQGLTQWRNRRDAAGHPQHNLPREPLPAIPARDQARDAEISTPGARMSGPA
jgi:hypothetical protein